MKRRKLLWNLCVTAVACIVVITYSPLVIPTGKSDPLFMNLSYTLRIIILLTIVLAADIMKNKPGKEIIVIL